MVARPSQSVFERPSDPGMRCLIGLCAIVNIYLARRHSKLPRMQDLSRHPTTMYQKEKNHEAEKRGGYLRSGGR